MEKKTILSVDNISKHFPGVKALDGASFALHEGEVLSLLGENGAGKSTLIKIIAGVQQQSSGNIYLEGKEVHFANPTEAKQAGISVVYQELANVPQLTVAENLFINQYGIKNGILNWKNIYAEAEKIVSTIGLKIDVRKTMSECNVAEKQQIEIVRAIYENAKVIILDEPTSALNDREIENLMIKIRELKSRGIAVILITHKMNEIFEVSDSVVVLRDGISILQKNIHETNEQELISAMIGRTIENMYPVKDNVPGDILIQAENLDNAFVNDISFEVHKGEILGVYGLMGSGHQELGLTLFGCVPNTKGTLKLEGKSIDFTSPKKCIHSGFAFVPSERKSDGLVQTQTVSNNIMTASYEKKGAAKIVNYEKETKAAEKWIRDLSIKTRNAYTVTETLSGGNQQKVVLAKWLETKPKVMILSEPTRGIDVGSKKEIYTLLNQMCKQGIAIIMITSEMPELLGMANRAIVIYENAIQATLTNDQLTEENVMIAAIGGKTDE